jgi:hypothetical protein
MMQPRHRRLLLGAVLGSITQLLSAAAFATPPQQAPRIIAAQLHRQGVACTTPRNAVQEPDNSTPGKAEMCRLCDRKSILAVH